MGITRRVAVRGRLRWPGIRASPCRQERCRVCRWVSRSLVAPIANQRCSSWRSPSNKQPRHANRGRSCGQPRVDRRNVLAFNSAHSYEKIFPDDLPRRLRFRLNTADGGSCSCQIRKACRPCPGCAPPKTKTARQKGGKETWPQGAAEPTEVAVPLNVFSVIC